MFNKCVSQVLSEYNLFQSITWAEPHRQTKMHITAINGSSVLTEMIIIIAYALCWIYFITDDIPDSVHFSTDNFYTLIPSRTIFRCCDDFCFYAIRLSFSISSLALSAETTLMATHTCSVWQTSKTLAPIVFCVSPHTGAVLTPDLVGSHCVRIHPVAQRKHITEKQPFKRKSHSLSRSAHLS